MTDVGVFKKILTCILTICSRTLTQSLEAYFFTCLNHKNNLPSFFKYTAVQLQCSLSLKQRRGGVCGNWSCRDREKELQHVFENVPSVEPTGTRSVDNYWCLRTTGWQPITSAWYISWPLACLLL